MAPEVIAETGHGKKADIWSIGCTLCEMATGKPPWSSEHNHLAVLLIIGKILFNLILEIRIDFCLANGTKPPADLPDTCSVEGQEFFRLCLTRNPLERPSASDLLVHPFLIS
jgi:serine/threonine protein kinase